MTLTKMQEQLVNYVKDNGGKVRVDTFCEETGVTLRSANALITGLCADLKNPGAEPTNRRKGLIARENVEVDGETVKYIYLTDAGMAWAPDAE